MVKINSLRKASRTLYMYLACYLVLIVMKRRRQKLTINSFPGRVFGSFYLFMTS